VARACTCHCFPLRSFSVSFSVLVRMPPTQRTAHSSVEAESARRTKEEQDSHVENAVQGSFQTTPGADGRSRESANATLAEIRTQEEEFRVLVAKFDALWQA
jgi:hypothetical protein